MVLLQHTRSILFTHFAARIEQWRLIISRRNKYSKLISQTHQSQFRKSIYMVDIWQSCNMFWCTSFVRTLIQYFSYHVNINGTSPTILFAIRDNITHVYIYVYIDENNIDNGNLYTSVGIGIIIKCYCTINSQILITIIMIILILMMKSKEVFQGIRYYQFDDEIFYSIFSSSLII